MEGPVVFGSGLWDGTTVILGKRGEETLEGRCDASRRQGGDSRGEDDLPA